MTSFNEFNLSKELLSAIKQMGFERPSQIQEKSIPILLAGEDIIAQAQTGSGKTAAFAIPLIEKIDVENKQTQALILCPTRELVVQVTNEIKKLLKYKKSISVFAIFGGQDIKIQLKALSNSCQIIVGTPGRIMDHMRRRSLKLDQIQYLVLDEADRMLDMGFREDMEKIIRETPRTRQTLMFSATMNKTITMLMERYQKKPTHINTSGSGVQSQQIEQIYFHIKDSDKLNTMLKLIEHFRIFSGIIFCNTRRKVDDLNKKLSKSNIKVAALHGEIPQNKRNRTMEAFRKGKVEILIATDVAARGLDVNDLNAVINYDIPRFDQDYIHRIGRTGRAGKKGLALSLVTGSEIKEIEFIAKKNKVKIQSAEELCIKGLEDIEFASGRDALRSEDRRSSKSNHRKGSRPGNRKNSQSKDRRDSKSGDRKKFKSKGSFSKKKKSHSKKSGKNFSKSFDKNSKQGKSNSKFGRKKTTKNKSFSKSRR